MQEMILLGAIIAIGIAIYILNMLNTRDKYRRSFDRHAESIKKIWSADFSERNYEEFHKAWIAVSRALKVEPEALRPDDKIESYIPKHLPELFIDELERFFESAGISPNEISESSNVKEVVTILLERRR